MSLYDTVAGALDHAAGSTDEAFARQFDSEPGGGFADWDTWAGIGDHLAGSTDEYVSQQFDDTPGGGPADDAAQIVWATVEGQADWWAGEYDERAQEAVDNAVNPLQAARPILIGGAGLAVALAALTAARDDDQ